MKFYTIPHTCHGGIDLHVNWMYLGVLNANAQMRLHNNTRTDPQAFLRTLKPFREDVVVCVDGMFT